MGKGNGATTTSSELRARLWELEIVGSSTSLMDTVAQLQRAAAFQVPILLHGPTGSGKESLARFVHVTSGVKGPFVPVNCAQLRPDLASSLLFGHRRGAFTGATADRPGLIQEADDGILFLDEIGELELSVQAQLLRALQERKILAVGSNRELPFTARVIVATHRNLETMIAEGSFREDLYARLAQVVIRVPPLSDRGEDVLQIARHFLSTDEMCRGRHWILSREAAELLLRHPWPRNVRELQTVLRRIALTAGGRRISAQQVQSALSLEQGEGAGSAREVQLEEVLSAVGLGGAGGESLSALLARVSCSRSTLLRALREKVANGEVERIGSGGLTRYRWKQAVETSRNETPALDSSQAIPMRPVEPVNTEAATLGCGETSSRVRPRRVPKRARVRRRESSEQPDEMCQKVLDALETTWQLHRLEVARMLSVSVRTASRLLTRMAEEGLLEPVGQARARRYRTRAKGKFTLVDETYLNTSAG